MTIESGKYYQLLTPEFPTIVGQGDMPTGLEIQKDGTKTILPFGQIFKTSTQVETANLDSGLDYPYISSKIVEKNIEQFQLIDGDE